MATERTPHEQEAYDLGASHAIAAASWVLDGNTRDSHYVALLKMIEDGDPRMEEHLPRYPDLSGEWADDPTPLTLVEDITGQTHITDEDEDLVCGLADAYEEGVTDAFMPEIERLLNGAIS